MTLPQAEAVNQPRLGEMPHLLNRLVRQRNAPSPPEKLYGAIVAQARLPVFYAEYGVPDTLDGRFAVLSLHLFVLLRRLKQGGAAASTMGTSSSMSTSTRSSTVWTCGLVIPGRTW